jgi:hypothetical protein
MTTYTRQDKEETDSAGHKLIRAATKAPITEDDIPFTTKEIQEEIKGMDKTKAPREDGITSDILHCAFSLLPESTTALFNGCLRMACFPSVMEDGDNNTNNQAGERNQQRHC